METVIKKVEWKRQEAPRRILAIRLQALGDVVITLPYLQTLQRRLPGTRLDFLTRKETDDIPRSLPVFQKVYSIGGGRNFKLQNFSALALLPQLFSHHYDVVIDLQANPLSRWIRKVLTPSAWSEFDRTSPISAAERTRSTINAVGIGEVEFEPLSLKKNPGILNLLYKNGWRKHSPLVVLNPAGYFPSRNWPLENYIHFAKLWQKAVNPETQFVALGTSSLAPKATIIQRSLNESFINLVGKTTPSEAMGVLQKATLVLSEDSGLMHMAWVVGTPTLALFGSSRSDWSAPQGENSLCLNSSDLPCGECMEAECRYGDVHCLSRYTPELVYHQARALLQKNQKELLTR